MTVIIDYGAGNLFSLKNALDYLGIDSKISGSSDMIQKADRLILPGVGAFPDAMRMLKENNLVEIIKEEAIKKPLLGICLGMQMLFEKSFEFSETDGLGLIKGKVEKMNAPVIPQMGWNALEKETHCTLSNSFNEGDYFYFVHSYAAVCDSANVVAYCDYSGKIPALVFNGNVFGCQFHPEKSGDKGLNILREFSEL